jgi:hypothetical protein
MNLNFHDFFMDFFQIKIYFHIFYAIQFFYFAFNLLHDFLQVFNFHSKFFIHLVKS